MTAHDGRFYVERIRGGRIVGTVTGATYERATGFYVDHGIRQGDDVVRVRGFLADGLPGGPDSPLVYELKRGCGCGCGFPYDRCPRIVAAADVVSCSCYVDPAGCATCGPGALERLLEVTS